MLGYPGETPTQVDASHEFLSQHESYLDRVRISRFKVIPGTRFHEMYDRSPQLYPGIPEIEWDFRRARARYHYVPAMERGYRRSKARLLRLVHRINRRPLRLEARVFDGLMADRRGDPRGGLRVDVGRAHRRRHQHGGDDDEREGGDLHDDPERVGRASGRRRRGCRRRSRRRWPPSRSRR